MQRPEKPPGTRTFVNCGAGPRGGGRVPTFFDDWREIRVDLDRTVDPDIIGSITDLSEIPDGVAEAVWTSHCLEHLYAHEVPTALGEFRRIMAPDGFLCLNVPDLQAVAELIARDLLDDVAYESPAGPVTPHDMVYGHSPALARGQVYMAHRCGFTRKALRQRLVDAGFEDFVLARNEASIELSVVAARTSFGDAARRTALLSGLGF
jgi:predicted SAM-dependent methyltransferase